ncbi:GntR family transcriptional regulator [Actinospica sp.]|jgi:DNA-binding GntR family transcriptional regulator|uniref:GntR family transcriptional regulator n=1 Tax=Actinospica sp. TaxID=1872142 RepID=UPI002C4658B8|nr:GntR family transcriptional regulator [Actinospica sp.]HWG25566.1 GntR family transcriptional regulator [Actinospica sp.]
MSEISRSRFSAASATPIRPETKSDLAYQQIRQKILEGELAPETSLDQEALAEWLGLSTTPVREALRRLQSERLVVSRAHRDTVVAPLSVDSVEQVYAVRLALDPLAASMAAAHADDGERAGILALSQDRPAGTDALSHVSFNRRLHRAIYAASGNTVLIEILDSLWDLSDRYRMVISKDVAAVEMAQDEHHAIAAAVVDGDPERAADLMRDHLAASLDLIRSTVPG